MPQARARRIRARPAAPRPKRPSLRLPTRCVSGNGPSTQSPARTNWSAMGMRRTRLINRPRAKSATSSAATSAVGTTTMARRWVSCWSMPWVLAPITAIMRNCGSKPRMSRPTAVPSGQTSARMRESTAASRMCSRWCTVKCCCGPVTRADGKSEVTISSIWLMSVLRWAAPRRTAPPRRAASTRRDERGGSWSSPGRYPSFLVHHRDADAAVARVFGVVGVERGGVGHALDLGKAAGVDAGAFERFAGFFSPFGRQRPVVAAVAVGKLQAVGVAAHGQLVVHALERFGHLVDQRLCARRHAGGAQAEHGEVGLVDDVHAQAFFFAAELDLVLEVLQFGVLGQLFAHLFFELLEIGLVLRFSRCFAFFLAHRLWVTALLGIGCRVVLGRTAL